jgi:hypothetical protein
MAICEAADEKLACSHPWLAEALFALDARLRRTRNVFEYSTHPSCIFRLDIARCPRDCVLPDWLRTDQRIARLHFWNEHVPPVPQNGATIGWARATQQQIALSLRELAHYLSSHSDLEDIAAICADVPCGTKSQSAQVARIMAHYGFEVVSESQRLSIGRLAHRFCENILISLIVFVQNARALRLDSLSRVRVSIFISRHALEERFGVGGMSRSEVERGDVLS